MRDDLEAMLGVMRRDEIRTVLRAFDLMHVSILRVRARMMRRIHRCGFDDYREWRDYGGEA